MKDQKRGRMPEGSWEGREGCSHGHRLRSSPRGGHAASQGNANSPFTARGQVAVLGRVAPALDLSLYSTLVGNFGGYMDVLSRWLAVFWTAHDPRSSSLGSRELRRFNGMPRVGGRDRSNLSAPWCTAG